MKLSLDSAVLRDSERLARVHLKVYGIYEQVIFFFYFTKVEKIILYWTRAGV